MTSQEKALRKQLAKSLASGEAHIDWKKAISSFPAKFYGTRPPGSPHSAWELLEHMRICQWDIVEFSRDAKHESPDFPSGYWPKHQDPPSPADWKRSFELFESDLKAMQALITNPKTDLFQPIPHGTGQTILREALLVVDHNSYHLGQLVLIRRMLSNE